MKATLALAVRKHVVAFETPLQERKTLRAFKPIGDIEVFQWINYLLSSDGMTLDLNKTRELMMMLIQLSIQESVEIPTFLTLIQWEDKVARYTISEILTSNVEKIYILITYRPRQLLPLSMVSARHAVRFVHTVVALITANAYVSTLGGGHFLCRHVIQSRLLAKVQIGISMGLQDPVLESKCRVHLMYNALQVGNFKRAREILKREEAVAEELESRELRNVCYAAKVYFNKMNRLHKEQLLLDKTGHTTMLYDNFYRQRIVQEATYK
ncbi:uncharacterized protein PHALS_01610 [Plasmopara halstedii]|uniref:Uncharacterized protein n=1 Tax=Plasmopara halstedii TaxID=4781 RepID=A0A0P1AT37_PLAHL|nr:uncharacterized protein PHALS_01610 [Plasmopara halstedii]CEG45304.1 hypothetical protein PHALS_01610 [Plasmopara halstedii]|eukprot:XP_024581673.1 hypothetical protein PHALS_01610 [Plasmopara halstedii]